MGDGVGAGVLLQCIGHPVVARCEVAVGNAERLDGDVVTRRLPRDANLAR